MKIVYNIEQGVRYRNNLFWIYINYINAINEKDAKQKFIIWIDNQGNKIRKKYRLIKRKIQEEKILLEYC